MNKNLSIAAISIPIQSSRFRAGGRRLLGSKLHLLIAVAMAALIQSIPLRADEAFPLIWSYEGGLAQPESAYLDRESGFVYVSNMLSGSDRNKGIGFISKLSMQGEMVNLKWVDGLNSPKGLRSFGGVLWVSDNDRLVAIDIKSGRVVKTVLIEGATALNDVAIDERGVVYVTEMRLSTVFAHADGRTWRFLEGEELEHANGIQIHHGKMYLAGTGDMPITADSRRGRLIEVDMKTKEIRYVTPDRFATLDAVESDGRGGFLLTDWRSGNVFQVGSDGIPQVIMSFGKGAADASFLADKKWLILPIVPQNRVAVFDLSLIYR